MIKAIITFIFGNAFWDYIVDYFDSPQEIIENTIITLAIVALIKYLKEKFISIDENGNSTNINSHFDASFALNNIGNYQQAIQECNRAIALNANDSVAYNNRGFAYDKIGKYEQAIQDYTKSIELNNPDPSFVYDNRGLTYYEIGQYDQAIKDFNTSILLNANYANAYNNRGRCYEAIGNMTLAKADFEKARELGYNG